MIHTSARVCRNPFGDKALLFTDNMQMVTDSPLVVRRAEAARTLGVSARAVAALARSGQLREERIGPCWYVTTVSLRALIDRWTINPHDAGVDRLRQLVDGPDE